MNIQFHLKLTSTTKAVVIKNCSVAIIKDNHKLYCVKNLLEFLTRDLIGVNKEDINLIRNLKFENITHITI